MRYFFIILLLLFSHSILAKSVYILTDVDSKKYKEINHRILSAVKNYSNKHNLKKEVSLISYKDYKVIEKNDRVVLVGAKAFKYRHDVRERQPEKIIYSAITSNILTELEKNQQAREFVISLEPKNSSLIDISKQLINKQYKRKILLPASPVLIHKLRQELPASSLELISFYKIEGGYLNTKLLESELFQSSVLLAVYDPLIWRGQTAKTLLYLAYNHKVPVVAYSQAFLQAGASFALHTDLDAIAVAVAETVFHSQKAPLSNIIYPNFSLAKNDNVIRALHIHSPVVYKGEQ